MKRDSVKSLGTILLILITASSASAETSVLLAEGIEAHPGIDAAYERMNEAYQNLDVDSAGSLYTIDASYLAPGQPVIEGRDAIRDVFDQYFKWVDETHSSISITFDILSRRFEGSAIIDIGIFTVERTTRVGTSSSRGKFVVVAVEGDDGLWRFVIDTYSDLPEEATD